MIIFDAFEYNNRVECSIGATCIRAPMLRYTFSFMHRNLRNVWSCTCYVFQYVFCFRIRYDNNPRTIYWLLFSNISPRTYSISSTHLKIIDSSTFSSTYEIGEFYPRLLCEGRRGFPCKEIHLHTTRYCASSNITKYFLCLFVFLRALESHSHTQRAGLGKCVPSLGR